MTHKYAMKRAYDSKEEKEEPLVELIDDIWGYIINLYYHVRLNEQWQLIKKTAVAGQVFIPPVAKIEIYGRELFFYTILVVDRIHRLHWDNNLISGFDASLYEFNRRDPVKARYIKDAHSIIISHNENDNDQSYSLPFLHKFQGRSIRIISASPRNDLFLNRRIEISKDQLHPGVAALVSPQ